MKITALLVFRVFPDGKSPVILSKAYDLTQFGVFDQKVAKQFITFFGRTVAGRTPPEKLQSVQHEHYLVHSHNRNGLCALAFMDTHYPVRSAFSILNKVMDEHQKVSGDSWQSAEADSSETRPYLDEAISKFQDPAEAEKLLKIQRDLDETNYIAHKTIDSVLAKGEKLDDLMSKSSDFNVASEMSHDNTAKNSNQWCTIL